MIIHKFTALRSSGKLTIQILRKVSTEGMTQTDVTDALELVRNRMLEEFNRVSAESRQPKLPNTGR